MFSIGNTITRHLSLDTNITDQVGSKIFNIVAVMDGLTAPYVVVEINSVTPTHTKEYFTHSDLSFSVIVLTSRYNDLNTISQKIQGSLECKTIKSESTQIENIMVSNWSEGFDAEFELYVGKISFNAIALNTQ